MEKSSDYLSGAELLKMTGVLAYELVRAIRRQVVPYPTNTIDGQFRTPETDPAFYDPKLCESPQAWLEQVNNAVFFKPFVFCSMPQIMAEVGTVWTQDTQEHGEAPAVPPFATPSELVQYHKALGVHEPHELARLVDEEFTGKAKLTAEELGVLLPAKDKEAKTPEGCRSQGKRLRRLYKKSQ